jgi:endothelin-converting enzyme/putative endopeptidase
VVDCTADGGRRAAVSAELYNFSALLQPPKFDPAASDATNYGAIGAILGHEISHLVDSLGADYQANGRKTRWWTATDLAHYQDATLPLVQQFSHYQPFPGLAIDGKVTLVENVADLAGLESAFDAHRLALGPRANDPEWVRQQDRQFFIGFARAWRAKYSDDALQAQVTNDHAPENYRVATVRNLERGTTAFGVRPGHRLYLEPKAEFTSGRRHERSACVSCRMGYPPATRRRRLVRRIEVTAPSYF